eukprot:jgi/Botrbrau1/14473/Bobra.0014s0111.1
MQKPLTWWARQSWLSSLQDVVTLENMEGSLQHLHVRLRPPAD